MVALAVLVAAVGNTNALPRQTAAECTIAESQLLQADITVWAGEFVEEGPTIDDAAMNVIQDCDDDADNILSQHEFVACLRSALDDPEISDSCYDFLDASGDSNGDGTVGVEEITELLSLISGAARNEGRVLKRDEVLSEEDCPQEQAVALQMGVAQWLSGLIATGLTPEAVSEQVAESCDGDKDSILSDDEFVSCLAAQVGSDSIGDSCYDIFIQYADENQDGIIEPSEMLLIVKMVAGGP